MIKINKILTDSTQVFKKHKTIKNFKSKNTLNTKVYYLIDKIKEITDQNILTKKCPKLN